MKPNLYLYILIMAGVSFLIRVLPMLLLKKPIKNRFIRSFLYYVPYVTIAVMTFPAILQAAQTPWMGVVALLLGIVLSWIGANMVTVAVACSAIVLLMSVIV